ncbi:hypothetical protein MNBD_GAMMA10-2313 [hydrothermal vent metagenome]|uniref:Uncharacterized protein n=1 Tax=hydrothermal vent metagenome TaxID=652676 RepID=A0A3B0XAX5_9ZZZZ
MTYIQFAPSAAFFRAATYCSHIRSRHFLLCVCLLITTAAFAGTEAAPPEKAVSVSIPSLVDQSSKLVQEAISSNANASRFRIDATLYRESLRSLMLNSDTQSTPSTHTKNMLMELVRMSALLQSAAACKTGRFIVCPIELRQQLLSQQKRLQTFSAQKG